jgi:hypothetical protein
MDLQSRAKEVQMQIYPAIDWSEAKHEAVVVNEVGAMVTQLVIPYPTRF